MKTADINNGINNHAGNSLEGLPERLEKRDKRALSRMISLVENEDPLVSSFIKKIYKKTGRSYRIGITGPPGAGKSTLVNALARKIRERGLSLGIVAVDPTSPFSGGALLGDRIRMTPALMDKDIYMRSMASRGGIGGIARTTSQVADLMDAFGFDVLMLETVGVGQLEVEVSRIVDTTLVVLVPEAGGNVQAMKAGLIEVADIFVVNKADRKGAETMKQDLEDALSLMPPLKDSQWQIPVLLTSAMESMGINPLTDTLFLHKSYLEEKGLFQYNRKKQSRNKILEIIKHRLERELWENPRLTPFLDRLSQMVSEGKMDPYEAGDTFLKRAKVPESDRLVALDNAMIIKGCN